jgi:putative DNA primase/helicase
VNPILAAALDLLAHGYSVIPIRTDGSKAPALPSWKYHTRQLATEVDATAWFCGDDPHDLGVVQGAVSGGAELTEIEGRAAARLPELKALAEDTGLADLWALVTTGWVELSPSGGYHFHYRLDGEVPGNLKLARAADKLVLAETRGEGGQVVVAPSRHHATGRPWTRLIGGPSTAPTLTVEQRDAFHALLRTLDEQPDAPVVVSAPAAAHDPTAGITPGDDYENRTDWTDILTPHGWTLVSQRGRTRYWLRPGKPRGSGLSATTGHADDRDRLFVFTSSTDFAQEVPYTKLGAYAVLEHGGDFSAAAKALARAGFGQHATALAPADTDDLAGLIAPTSPTVDPTPGGDDATEQTTPAAAAPKPSTKAATGGRPAVGVAKQRQAHPNEDNTALLLVDQHADTIRYCPGRGTWLTWNGHRWTNDDRGLVSEHVRAIARRLPNGDGWATYTKRALSAQGVAGIKRLAQSDQRIVAPVAQLDARPYELNTPAGVVDLRTGSLGAPDPGALHTRSTTVAPDLDAEHPLWDRFLADTFAGDPAMTTYIQRLLGLSIVGVVLEQLFPFAHGAGANGKTTLLSVVQHLVGMGETGYAMSAPASMLLASRSEGHPTELARLSGARLVVTSELEDSQRFAEAKIKLLTGKDTITGRFMRQDWFDFVPTHTLWLLANHQPEVRAGGIAFWRRIRLLPFEHTVPPEKRVPDLEDRLITREGPAILGWVIRGAADYFAHGLAEPESVRAATAAYQRDQDTVARFVDEQCTTGPTSALHLKVKSAELRAAYETWCRIEGEEPVNPKAFAIALRAKYGVLPERTNSARFLAGIRLNDVDQGAADASPTTPRWTQEGLA